MVRRGARIGAGARQGQPVDVDQLVLIVLIICGLELGNGGPPILKGGVVVVIDKVAVE